MNWAIQQASELARNARILSDRKNSLEQTRGSIGGVWRGTEIKYVNNSILRLNKDLGNLANRIISIQEDIKSVAYEIRREEEAAEKAAAEKAAREAAAAKANS